MIPYVPYYACSGCKYEKNIYITGGVLVRICSLRTNIHHRQVYNSCRRYKVASKVKRNDSAANKFMEELKERMSK